MYRILTAQVLGKKTALVASSPGPFGGNASVGLVKRALQGYSLILNREARSLKVLADMALPLDNVRNRACPSISYIDTVAKEIKGGVAESPVAVVGVNICGWNIPDSSWDSRTLDRNTLVIISDFLRRIYELTDSSIALFSHSNAFVIEGATRTDSPGRDHDLLSQVHEYLKRIDENLPIHLEERVRTPRDTIKLIQSFDLLVAGRAHCCVAGLSLGVPTVMIDYANGPVAHKTSGFMELFGQSDRIVSLRDLDKAIAVIAETWLTRTKISNSLSSQLGKNLQLVDKTGEEIRDLVNGS